MINRHRIVIMGAASVGKSAITVRLVCNEFRSEYDATISDSYTCMIQVRGQNEWIDIMDTSGTDQFVALQQHWIRESDEFLLVYDIQSLESFEYVKKCYEIILKNKLESHRNGGFNLVLVGNKCDLPCLPDYDFYNMRLTQTKIECLTFGYLRQNEKSIIIPGDIKKICCMYTNEHIAKIPIQVRYKMGKELAESWTKDDGSFCVPFLMTSAKTGDNVLEAFEQLIILSQDAAKPIQTQNF